MAIIGNVDYERIKQSATVLEECAPSEKDNDKPENKAHPEPGYEKEMPSSCRNIVSSRRNKALSR